MTTFSSDDYPDEEPEEEEQSKDYKKSKSKSRSKSKSKKSKEESKVDLKKAKYIRKYTYNGSGPLFESVIIGDIRRFVSYTRTNGNYSLQPFKYIERSGEYDLYPAETADSQNPLPYSFESIEQVKEYVELAKRETFETLFSEVKSVFKKYVNVEDYYATILSADIIYSYFQDKFGTTHYNIFVGDNGSGKNSALLVFKHLGYRVFYVVGASAPNYFTFLGDTEECQGSIAEDEAEDIAYDRDKNKVVRTGYCSGATVPKVDLSFGRKQDAWLTYCHKWFAMEDLPDYKKIKGILDRSFIYNFVVGKVDYNIKDITRHSGDSRYKSLYEEILNLRKLLFAFRLLRYDDKIPDIKLNIIHRNEELTKPLLRLFSYRNDAPIALKEIRLGLSKFVLGRNELKKSSIESKLLETVNNLIKRRREWKNGHDGKEHPEFEGLEPYSFYNEHIRAELRSLLDAVDIPNRSEAFYSPEYGAITHKRITGLYKSKLRAESFVKRDDDRIKRGLKFLKEVLEKLDLYYDVPDKIEIVTDVTDITHSKGKEG